MQIGDPVKEEQRLNALYRYSLLDTPTEDAFDCITRVARTALNVPIALITLIDKDRQWFKSRQGVTIPETPRDVSFCSRTIEGDKMLLIPDMRKDSIFRDNPLVAHAPYLRFYCGVPLRTHDGYNIGSLCVLGHKARQLSDEETALLNDLADLAIDQIELRHAADIDYVTGIASNRVLVNAGAQEIARVQSIQKSLSLVVFEIDHFSDIGQRYGRVMSDAVLQNVVDNCKFIPGMSNIFSRVSGGRFAVLLSGAGIETANELAGKIVEAIRKMEVHAQPAPLKVTATASAVAYTPYDKDFSHLYTRGEIVLQQTKGDNQKPPAPPVAYKAPTINDGFVSA